LRPVTFPYDVRHDITFYGLKITKIWITVLGLVGSALLFAVDVPFLSLMFKLLLMVLIPVSLFIFFVFDMGQWIKRLRDFMKEPPLRLPDSRGKEGSVQSLIDVKARRSGGPFLDYKGGYVGVIMSVEPLPWDVMTEDDKTVEVSTFQAALSRALENNMVVSIYTDFDLELPRVEIERMALEWRTRFPVGSPLRSLAESRLAKFTDEDASSFRPVKPMAHVRLLWKPTNRDLPRRPRDEKEKDALVAMAFSSLIETFTGNLSAGGIHCKVLGSEAARDMVSRQLNPVDWRRVAPVANTDWESRLARQPAAVKEELKTPGAGAKEERAGRAEANLVTIVTFEQGAGTETISVTLELVDKLLQSGYSVSLIDADIYSPGSLNAEFGVTELPSDWRTALRAGEAALIPHKGLMYWGLSNDVFSVELSSSSSSNLWRVINEAGRWSHVTLVHLGENEATLANLIGKAKVVAVACRDCPEMNTALKFSFSKAEARLVTLNEQTAQLVAKNYRVKKCLVLDRDIEDLVDFACGRSHRPYA
jgi:hypothetical protein